MFLIELKSHSMINNLDQVLVLLHLSDSYWLCRLSLIFESQSLWSFWVLTPPFWVATSFWVVVLQGSHNQDVGNNNLAPFLPISNIVFPYLYWLSNHTFFYQPSSNVTDTRLPCLKAKTPIRSGGYRNYCHEQG